MIRFFTEASYRSEESGRCEFRIVHLYLDVSGSMTTCLPYLSAACREPFKRGELKIFAFSTVLSELKGHDLSKAQMQNTGGTDINAVLGHVTAIPARRRPKVILIATDGYVGRGRGDLIARLGRMRGDIVLLPRQESLLSVVEDSQLYLSRPARKKIQAAAAIATAACSSPKTRRTWISFPITQGEIVPFGG